MSILKSHEGSIFDIDIDPYSLNGQQTEKISFYQLADD